MSVLKKQKKSKNEPKREYYVFFNLTSPFCDNFAKIKAKNAEEAKLKAFKEFGLENFGSITSNPEYAQAKIRLYEYEEIFANAK